MPGAQLISAAIETGLNALLELDADSQQRLIELNGKQLKVTVREFPWPLVFVFSERVDVLTSIDDAQTYDCHIQLSVQTLEALKDSSQITQLIKQDKLALEGDVKVAQAFSQVLSQLDIDWEEQASRIIGDVPSHALFDLGSRVIAHAKGTFSSLATAFSEGLVEEKQVMAPAAAVEQFCLQVSDIRSATARLEARLARLESKQEQ